MKLHAHYLAVFGILAHVSMLTSCESELQDESSTQSTLDELQQKYGDLVKDKIDIPVDWASEDLENIGDWEYRVVELTYTSPQEFEAELNEYGNERWQLLWLERTSDGFLAVMKKPSISYLSKIPLSELGRIVTSGSGGPE